MKVYVVAALVVMFFSHVVVYPSKDIDQAKVRVTSVIEELRKQGFSNNQIKEVLSKVVTKDLSPLRPAQQPLYAAMSMHFIEALMNLSENQNAPVSGLINQEKIGKFQLDAVVSDLKSQIVQLSSLLASDLQKKSHQRQAQSLIIKNILEQLTDVVTEATGNSSLIIVQVQQIQDTVQQLITSLVGNPEQVLTKIEEVTPALSDLQPEITNVISGISTDPTQLASQAQQVLIVVQQLIAALLSNPQQVVAQVQQVANVLNIDEAGEAVNENTLDLQEEVDTQDAFDQINTAQEEYQELVQDQVDQYYDTNEATNQIQQEHIQAQEQAYDQVNQYANLPYNPPVVDGVALTNDTQQGFERDKEKFEKAVVDFQKQVLGILNIPTLESGTDLDEILEQAQQLAAQFLEGVNLPVPSLGQLPIGQLSVVNLPIN